MSPLLTSPFLDFDMPGQGSWGARPRGLDSPEVDSAHISVSWRGAGRDRFDVLALAPQGYSTERRTDPRLGDIVVAAGEERLGSGELEAQVEFGLCIDAPLLLWRLSLGNASAGPVYLVRAGMLEGGKGVASGPPVRWGAGGSADGDPVHALAFYSTGWQSWGYAGSLLPSDRMPWTRLGPFTRPRLNSGVPRPRGRGRFASDMFGVLSHRDRRTGVLAGFLSQRNTFGALQADLRNEPATLRMWADLDGVRLAPGAAFETDWACLQFVDLTEPEPVAAYLDAAARYNRARSGGPAAVGWCSWYFYFEKITQQALLDNLAWAATHREDVPLDLIQLDDGFEAQVGDWYDLRKEFPDGLASLRRRVHASGFRPGLWLAPFIAKPKARLLAEHPDWILRDDRAAPVNAGFAWNVFSRALDATHPAVLDHVDALIRTAVHEWGYGYLKLDFLYAAALPGKRHDPTRTRAQALHGALERIRLAAGPDTTLVGCGCPLGPAIGIVDSMRIGTDVAPRWQPAFLGIELPFRREPDFPATRSAARNALTRSMLHRRWWVNDPDCLLLRERPSTGDPAALSDSRTHLTGSEAQFLATVIALTAGPVIVSDDLPHLGPERAAWLARLIPPLPRAARVVDLFDTAYPAALVLPLEGAAGAWHLVGLLNWADRPRTLQADLLQLGLPPAAAYHALDFWQQSYRRIEGRSLRLPSVAAHSVCLLGIRPVTPSPSWLGDSLHISQGLPLRSWQFHGAAIEAEIRLGRVAHGTAWMALPSTPAQALFDGASVAVHQSQPGIYSLDLEVHHGGHLEVRLS